MLTVTKLTARLGGRIAVQRIQEEEAMKTRGMLAVALLAVLLVAAAAQAQGVVLRYKYTQGGVDKYVMKGSFNGQVSGGQEAAMPLSITMDGGLTVKTSAVTSAGIASQTTTIDHMNVTSSAMGMETQMTVENGKTTILVNGQPMEMPQGTPGMDVLAKPIKAKIDSRGRVVSLDTSGMGDMFGGFDPSTLSQMSVAFPEGAVTPGQSWSNSAKMPMKIMGQNMQLALNFTYTFVGMEKYKGTDVARIGIKGTSTMSGTAATAPLQTMKQTFSGYDYFDTVKGRSLYTKLDMEQTMSGAGAPNQPMNMSMAGNVEITRQ
jgi:hypothetical protein